MSGILSAFVGGTYSSAPVNSVAPAVTGTAQARQTLSCSTGTWTGVPTPTFTYQWQYGVSNTNISGATSSTYVVSSTYVGQTIRCVVTATNSIGTASANSNSTSAVTANVPAAPTIGTATAASATSATVTYTAPADNGGATITTYTATSSPGGITGTLSTSGSGTITVSGLTTNTAYTFTVTATNSVGTSAASAASNSITPVLQGFITGLSQASRSPIPTAITVDSSGNSYVSYSNASPAAIIKFSSSGSVVFQTGGYANLTQGYMYLDSSNNYYYLGKYTNNEPMISKFNSSDTFQWSRRWTESSFSSFAAFGEGNAMSTDASGNLYEVLSSRVTYCCGQDVYISFRKLNSSGVLQALTNNAVNPGTLYSARPYGIIPVGSNILLAFNAINSLGTDQQSFLYLDSAGVKVSQYAYARLSASSFTMEGFAYDYTNNVGYGVGRTNGTAAILKVNSTGVAVWAYTISSLFSGYSAAVDSSGNVYVLSRPTTNMSINIVKINSSGVLQWSRTLTNNTWPISDVDNLERCIAVQGSSFFVSSTRTTCNRDPFVFKAPIDGSATGSYSQGGQIWTYATTSTTLTAVTTQQSASFTVYPASAGGQTTQTLSLSALSYTSSTTTF